MKGQAPRLVALILFALAVIVATVAVALSHRSATNTSGLPAASGNARDRTPPTSTPTPTPAPPRLSPEQINGQDRANERQLDREARAFDHRPLLQQLPMVTDGVGIDIAGLAPNGRQTVLTVSRRLRSDADARAAFARAVAHAGDSKGNYQVRVVP